MKVLLLDDHPLVRSALESVIRTLTQNVTVQTASNGAQACALLQEQDPFDLALLDLHLPDTDGFSLMAQWRVSHPDLPVVIVSASEDPSDVVRALEEGAMGFIPKRTSNEVLMHALRMVMSGGIYVPPMALRRGEVAGVPGSAPTPRMPEGPHSEPLVARAQEPLPVGRTAYAGVSPVVPATTRSSLATLPALRLTPRQTEVLELLLQGQPNKLIARQLNLSVETVKDHVASLLRVLGVNSRTQAVLAVSQMINAGAAPQLTTNRMSSPLAVGAATRLAAPY